MASPAIVVRSANADDIDDIARVIATAFANGDPIEEFVFPDERERRRRSPRMLRVLIRHRYLPAGGAGVATINGVVVGAVLWQPAVQSKSIRHKALSGPQLLWAIGPAVSRARAVDAAIARAAPATPHLFAIYLGCEPTLQRHGVGRALLAAVIDEAEKQQVPLYLLCKDANVGYYQRWFGLAVVGRTTIGRGGPDMNIMCLPSGG